MVVAMAVVVTVVVVRVLGHWGGKLSWALHTVI
jgi:hypothetical protein